MDTSFHSASSWLRRLVLLPVALFLGATGALAQQEAAVDPPGRVATLTQQVGSVVFAPDGEEEWVELPLHRPLTRGDRVWTDRGSRAELHMGTTAVHLDSQAHLAFFELDDQAAQLSLTQGSVNLRVRDLAPRENVEVDTPNLAVRAAEPGDWRVDVDTDDGTTRVLVRSGSVLVYGERGESIRLAAGQQATFEGRDLRQVRGRIAGTDDFDQWAGDLNRREDMSASARHVPRGVVGYQLLDNHGTWDSDPTYGAVWYPRGVAADWAPYRYGRWEYVGPWGWTWVDDAPWGFAPFHYGRWARVGPRWAWVPGRIGPRPVYSPALVAFLGGGSGFSISIGVGSGPGIGWYPLAPGEAWWPTYRTTHVYVTNVNRYIVVNKRHGDHVHRRHYDAITSVRADEFNRGRVRVRDNWRPVRPQDIANVQVTTTLPRPERGGGRDRDRDRERTRLVATPPPATSVPALPSRTFGGARDERREAREERRDDRREAREERRDTPARPFVRQDDARPAAVETRRDQREQERAQREQQRALQEQQERQRDQAARQLHERQVREQAVREQSAREQAMREQAARQQERVQREQERAQREQERAQREQVRAQQEAAARQQQQERANRDAERARVREQRESTVRAQQERQQQVERAQQREVQRAQREQERAVRTQRAPEPQEERAPRGRPQRDDGDDERRGRGRGG